MARPGIAELMRLLEEWKAIHPIEVNESVQEISPSPLSPPPSRPPSPPRPPRTPRENSFYAQERGSISRHARVYCDRMTYRSWECDSVASLAECRRILQSKRLCVNHTGTQHNAVAAHLVCTANKGIIRLLWSFDNSWTPNNNQRWSGVSCDPRRRVCHPVVLLKLNGVTFRALLDTGATASYASGYT